MNVEKMKQLAEKKQIFLIKKLVNTNTRTVVIYKNKLPKLDKDWRDDINYDEIKETRSAKYKKYIYGAYTLDMPHNSFYKITKPIFTGLFSIGAVIK